MQPTRRQLAYLRDLALRTGQTFTPPTSREQASREIARLRQLSSESSEQLYHERHTLAGELHAGEGAHAAVQQQEIRGYGSTARWN